MPLRKDIWRPAIVEAPLAEILARGSLDGLALRWLPSMGAFRFLADPFGLWRDGRLHCFVETYDYRVRIGAIEVLVFDDKLNLIARAPALAEPWHLSYPFVFEAEGGTWMLPEAYRSGRLTLYRAADFPTRWVRAHVVELGELAVDATPLFHHGRWWLFYSAADRKADRMRTLNIAVADRLAGPWTPHPGNPVRIDLAGARPGGSPMVIDGVVVLPVQDCARTYGGAIRPLRIETLTPDRFDATLGPAILPPAAAAPFSEGLHTLASAGAVTLVDLKRTELSLHGLAIEARRELRRLVRRP